MRSWFKAAIFTIRQVVLPVKGNPKNPLHAGLYFVARLYGDAEVEGNRERRARGGARFRRLFWSNVEVKKYGVCSLTGVVHRRNPDHPLAVPRGCDRLLRNQRSARM